jgi:DNA-binding beta-propeller fold protein YncE
VTAATPARRATLSTLPRSKMFAMRTVFLLGCACVAGCTAPAEEVAPPADELFFPTGLAVAPSEAVAFVANANSELRWDSGTIDVIDLQKIDDIAAAWTATKQLGADCLQDPDHTETMICAKESLFIVPDVGVRIGNFATDIAVQDFGPTGALRLIVPTRGDPSITWVDWDGSRLSCSTAEGPNGGCDDAHRLSYVHGDPDLALLPDEPFDAYAATTFDQTGKPVSGYAVVSHLTTGAVTLVDSPPGAPAQIADVAGAIFAADPVTGLRGATGIVARPPGDMIYVASRSEDRVQMLTVGRPPNIAPPYLLYSNWFFLDFVGANLNTSPDTRGMTFSPTGDRLYAVSRNPPMLQIVDTSLDQTGFPRNKLVGATDICRQASTLAVADSGDGERAYVTCFQDGQLYVVDPRGLGTVEDIILVGRGPFAVAAAPNRKKIYVTNFLEDTIAVIDVAPGSKTRNRVVLRIGDQRAP